MISSTTHFGKVTRPDGVMLQLGQRSSERDVWLWVPTGTGHNQISPWSSPLTLSHWRECNELHFISSLPPGGLQLVSGSANFIRHFPPMQLAPASTRSRDHCSLDPAAGEEESEVVVAKREVERRDPLPGCSGHGGSEGLPISDGPAVGRNPSHSLILV
jgi:hypothetical protein